jgi:hypothetical protein
MILRFAQDDTMLLLRAVATLTFALFFALPLHAEFRDFASVPVSEELALSLENISAEAMAEHPKLTPANLSITLIDLGTDGVPVARASYRPENTFHPASVVKIFFLVGAYERVRERKLVMTPELQRGLRDMIVDSGNDATSFIVDSISGVSSGPDLHGRAFTRWAHQRKWINRYFASLGYDIQVSGKTWAENLYGREMQLLGKKRENRNRIASEQVAAVMLDIVEGRAVSASASGEMMDLLQRDVTKQRDAGENQVHEFLGEGLPDGSQLWSKAGWTSEVRHDAAYVILPDGRRFIAVVLTRGDSTNTELLPAISRRVVELFR